jgi:hypothetical protein
MYLSPDGYNWRSMGTETVSGYLSASGGGTLDQMGFGVLENLNHSTLIGSAAFSLPV